MPIARRSGRLGLLLRRVYALDGARRRDLLEATAALALASLAIRALPFRRIDRSLTQWQGRAGAHDPAAAERVRWAVEAMGARVPWRTVCFQKGLAAHWLMRRRGVASRLHYGVASDSAQGKIAAHVWVSVDGAVLLGAVATPFQCLQTYPLETPPGPPGDLR